MGQLKRLLPANIFAACIQSNYLVLFICVATPARCSFSSAQCGGDVAAGRGKCLFVVATNQTMFGWNKAADQCRARGGRPAVFKTPQDMQQVERLWDLLPFIPNLIYIGLKVQVRLSRETKNKHESKYKSVCYNNI
jgi:hypothetical protein